MPGLAICLSTNPISASRRERLRGAAALMQHRPRYSATTITEHNHADVRFTSYDQYPRMLFDQDDLRVFIEGAIYNKPTEQLHSELAQLGKRILTSDADCESLTQRWILENDGEYIALVFDTVSGNLTLMTDALGQLPLFYQELPGAILIAREPKYIIAAADNKRLDPIGIAEFLMNGYNMGDRTMSAEIKRFAPATLVRFRPHENAIKIQRVHQWRLGAEIDPSMALSARADSVAGRFREAVRMRARNWSGGSVALSLSGGLDSRLVAAALHREKVPFSSLTGLDHDHGNRQDAVLAKQVARLFDSPHTEYQLQMPALAEAQTLIRHQEGGSTVSMAGAQQHLERLEANLDPNTILFTGDGGNNVMYPFLPGSRARSVDDVVQSLVGTVFSWDIATIERILRVDRDMVRQTYRDAIGSYPETEPAWKYGHFKFLGRPYRFVMEGEDRTRFHYWLGTPFWSLPLVRELLTVPEEYKAHYRFYRAVFDRIDPRCTRIPDAAMLITVPFRFLPLYSRAKAVIKSHLAIYRGLSALLVRRKDPGYVLPDWEDSLGDIVDRSAILAEYFDVKQLKAVIHGGLSRTNYNLLATILFKVDLMERDFCQSEP